MTAPTCAQECRARCCRYVTLPLDDPEDQADHDYILWLLSREGMSVFEHADGHLYVRLLSPCRFLNEQNLCAIYEERPSICREYGNDGSCDYPTDPGIVREWKNREEYLAHMNEEVANV